MLLAVALLSVSFWQYRKGQENKGLENFDPFKHYRLETPHEPSDTVPSGKIVSSDCLLARILYIQLYILYFTLSQQSNFLFVLGL